MTETSDGGYSLVKLGDTDLTLEDPAHDIRGRDVYTSSGDEIGTVEDLYFDEDERRVRFLDVGAGGFLGIGEKHFMIPVGAVSEIEEDRITVHQSREKVLGSPPLDTKVVPGAKYQHEVTDYYGDLPYSPFGA